MIERNLSKKIMFVRIIMYYFWNKLRTKFCDLSIKNQHSILWSVHSIWGPSYGGRKCAHPDQFWKIPANTITSWPITDNPDQTLISWPIPTNMGKSWPTRPKMVISRPIPTKVEKSRPIPTKNGKSRPIPTVYGNFPTNPDQKCQIMTKPDQNGKSRQYMVISRPKMPNPDTYRPKMAYPNQSRPKTIHSD